MSRLTIEVTEEQHQGIKALAALQGKTIKEYAIQRLFAFTPEEKQAMLELKALLDQRIANALRALLKVASVREGRRAILEIV